MTPTKTVGRCRCAKTEPTPCPRAPRLSDGVARVASRGGGRARRRRGRRRALRGVAPFPSRRFAARSERPRARGVGVDVVRVQLPLRVDLARARGVPRAPGGGAPGPDPPVVQAPARHHPRTRAPPHVARRRGHRAPPRGARRALDRFSVPVHLDRLAGPLDKVHRDALAKRRVALALYRIPDHDDADDVYVAADENLPPERRPLPPTSRLDDFAYLGEAKIRLDQLLTASSRAHASSGERGSRHRYAIAPARARGTRPDAPRRCPRRVQRRRRALAAVRARDGPAATVAEHRGRCRGGDFLLHFSPPTDTPRTRGYPPRRPRASVSMGRGRVPARVLHARRGVGRPDGDTTRRESSRRWKKSARACTRRRPPSRLPRCRPSAAALRAAAERTKAWEGPTGEGVAFSSLLPRETCRGASNSSPTGGGA